MRQNILLDGKHSRESSRAYREYNFAVDYGWRCGVGAARWLVLTAFGYTKKEKFRQLQ